MKQKEIEIARQFRACRTARERKAFAEQHKVSVNRLWTLWLRAGRPEPKQMA